MYPAFVDKKTTVEINDPMTGEIEKLQFDITDWRQLDLESVIYAPIHTLLLSLIRKIMIMYLLMVNKNLQIIKEN